MVLELEASSAQIQRIVQSKTFRTSEVHRNLLQYLADKSLNGDAESLKEYTVGLDVFAKPESYDPRQESTVRMHVARLRQKLSEYYKTEGADDPIIVDLPKGGFRVTFEPRPTPPGAGPELPAETPPRTVRPARYWFEVVLVAALLVFAGAAVYFGTQLWRMEQTEGAVTREAISPELRQLWDPLLKSSRPLIVAVSTARPETSGTDAASLQLGTFLGRLQTRPVVLESDQIEGPEYAMGNVVFLGKMVDNKRMQALNKDRPFVLEADGIHNMQPQPGEPALFVDRLPADASDSEESYALISRAPGLYGNGQVLYISGNRVASITGGVQAFTDPMFAQNLVEKMRQADGTIPAAYQVVIRVLAMDDMPIEAHYVLHRALPPAAPRVGN